MKDFIMSLLQALFLLAVLLMTLGLCTAIVEGVL